MQQLITPLRRGCVTADETHVAAHAGIVLTNDGHAILREIDVNHPAAKVRALV